MNTRSYTPSFGDFLNHCQEMRTCLEMGLPIGELSLKEYDGIMLINEQINKIQREDNFKMRQQSIGGRF